MTLPATSLAPAWRAEARITRLPGDREKVEPKSIPAGHASWVWICVDPLTLHWRGCRHATADEATSHCNPT